MFLREAQKPWQEEMACVLCGELLTPKETKPELTAEIEIRLADLEVTPRQEKVPGIIRRMCRQCCDGIKTVEKAEKIRKKWLFRSAGSKRRRREIEVENENERVRRCISRPV